jgi:hypothetical protein
MKVYPPCHDLYPSADDMVEVAALDQVDVSGTLAMGRTECRIQRRAYEINVSDQCGHEDRESDIKLKACYSLPHPLES